MSHLSSVPSQAPTCYRHPNRETYVRCVRCDRPICPDCMISASVGFQCPECVNEGKATVRQPRAQFGGAIPSSPGLVTRVLIGINVAVFLIANLVGIDKVNGDYGLYPLAVANGDYYRVVTAGFLHANITHLLFNMFSLYLLGTPLEAILGRVRFALVYGMALLGGSVVSFCFSPYNVIGVGASGAIFGIFGAFAVVAWKQKLDLRPFAVLIAINLVIGFLPGTNIDWRAHLGGLAVGAIVAAGIVVPKPAQRTQVLIATVIVVLIVLAAMLAWRINDLQPVLSLYRR